MFKLWLGIILKGSIILTNVWALISSKLMNFIKAFNPLEISSWSEKSLIIQIF